ncbi:MAG: TldD/PmbA family protein [Pseudomonadota bacterium]
MDELKSLEADAQNLIQLVLKAGADACDVVVASGQSASIGVRDGIVETNKRSESDMLSIRAFCGKKVASVNSNTKKFPGQLAERVVAMAKVSPEDPFQGLAEDNLLLAHEALNAKVDGLELYDAHNPSTEDMQKLALECEKSGLSVSGVTKSMGAGTGWSNSGFVLATSQGFVGSYRRSGYSVSASLVAGDGVKMERDYDYDSAVHFSDMKSAEAIGKSAGERVVKRLHPQQVKSGAYPVVFDPRISAGILGTLTGAISGASVARKTSFLREKMNEAIAMPGIHVIDDPLMVRKAGSRAFDGEGVASKKMNLVEDGVLQTWLLDSATARELGLQTNGRASRSGSGTSPSTTNCYMAPGAHAPEALIAEIEHGLYLTETIGHGINMVTGDYSKGAAGFWIENGEITFPVAEITVAGNLADMFMNMTPANDLMFKYGTDAPTLRIEGMTIGGT